LIGQLSREPGTTHKTTSRYLAVSKLTATEQHGLNADSREVDAAQPNPIEVSEPKRCSRQASTLDFKIGKAGVRDAQSGRMDTIKGESHQIAVVNPYIREHNLLESKIAERHLMKDRASEIDPQPVPPLHIGAVPVGITNASTGKGSSVNHRTIEGDTIEHSRFQISSTHVRAAEIGSREAGTRQVSSAEHSIDQSSITQIGAPQVSTTKICALQVPAAQINTTKIYITKFSAT